MIDRTGRVEAGVPTTAVAAPVCRTAGILGNISRRSSASVIERALKSFTGGDVKYKKAVPLSCDAVVRNQAFAVLTLCTYICGCALSGGLSDENDAQLTVAASSKRDTYEVSIAVDTPATHLPPTTGSPVWSQGGPSLGEIGRA